MFSRNIKRVAKLYSDDKTIAENNLQADTLNIEHWTSSCHYKITLSSSWNTVGILNPTPSRNLNLDVQATESDHNRTIWCNYKIWECTLLLLSRIGLYDFKYTLRVTVSLKYGIRDKRSYPKYAKRFSKPSLLNSAKQTKNEKIIGCLIINTPCPRMYELYLRRSVKQFIKTWGRQSFQ